MVEYGGAEASLLLSEIIIDETSYWEYLGFWHESAKPQKQKGRAAKGLCYDWEKGRK